jgi:hypothetical protein
MTGSTVGYPIAAVAAAAAGTLLHAADSPCAAKSLLENL